MSYWKKQLKSNKLVGNIEQIAATDLDVKNTLELYRKRTEREKRDEMLKKAKLIGKLKQFINALQIRRGQQNPKALRLTRELKLKVPATESEKVTNIVKMWLFDVDFSDKSTNIGR